MRMPETCWAVFKRQVINLRSCWFLLVDSVESMMMHGLANPKPYVYLKGKIITQHIKYSSRKASHLSRMAKTVFVECVWSFLVYMLLFVLELSQIKLRYIGAWIWLWNWHLTRKYIHMCVDRIMRGLRNIKSRMSSGWQLVYSCTDSFACPSVTTWRDILVVNLGTVNKRITICYVNCMHYVLRFVFLP